MLDVNVLDDVRGWREEVVDENDQGDVSCDDRQEW